ncbi:MAG TPA: hypothetical protein VF074_13480, partial [Pyrinomonadaceae bacterium]
YLRKSAAKIHAVPHITPAKFLLRMWRPDSSSALASVDEPKVLRHLLSKISQAPPDRQYFDCCDLSPWDSYWPQPTTAASATDPGAKRGSRVSFERRQQCHSYNTTDD